MKITGKCLTRASRKISEDGGMKHRAGARPMLIVTVLGACAGYALRRANVAGGGAGALIALSVVLAVLWLRH